MRTLKKTIAAVITAVLLLSMLGISTVFAEIGDTGMDQDFDWDETGTDAVTITAYTGPGGAVTIPATLSGRTVVAIADNTFDGTFGDVSYKELITSVEIPAGVSTIEASTFKDFTALESVTFAGGTGLTTIGEEAFAGTALTSINVTTGSTSTGIEGLSMLTTIGSGAFSGTKLTSLKIPASVTTIGADAFSGCADLTSLTFAPEPSIGEIGSGAFFDTKLVSITLPDSIGIIGDSAFSVSVTNVTTLIKVVIYNPDVEIGAGAFKRSNSLVIYAPRGSTADAYCLNYPQDRINFIALETTVGNTSITSVVPSGSSRVTISWGQAERAMEYEVYRANTQAGSYSLRATTAERTYTDTGLTVGATYYYKVRGISTAGEDTYTGDYSEPVAATPLPGAPNSIYAVSAGYSSINLSWTPVQSVSGYEIWRANDTIGGVYSLVKTLSISTSIKAVQPNKYNFTSLTSGRKYFYKIRAYINVANPAGGTPIKCYGAYSGITMARPVPGAVTDLKAVQTGPKVIKLTWKSVPGTTRYEIWRKGPTDTQFVKYPYTASSNYFTNDINLDAEKEYSYQVRAYRSSTTYGDPGENGKIYGVISGVATVNLADYKVTGVVAKRYSNSQINITWSGITGVTGYEIQCGESEDELVDDMIPVPVDRKTYRYYYSKSLADNTEYFYRVRAYIKVTVSGEYPDGKRYGAWSDIVKAKT